MRIWHQSLIPYLPRQQLLGQHRELCALRGRGWGRPHATVNYIFKHKPIKLYAFHYLVMEEMKQRGYHPDEIWYQPNYRGTTLGFQENWADDEKCFKTLITRKQNIYSEHDDEYLQECLENLKSKGIDLYEEI